MFKKDFVQSISRRSGLPEQDVRAVLKAGHETTCEVLKQGDSVNIMGLGQIMLRARAEGKARDLRRGVSVDVPARAVIRFKPTRSVVDQMIGTDLSLLERGQD